MLVLLWKSDELELCNRCESDQGSNMKEKYK